MLNEVVVKQASLSELDQVVPLFDQYRKFYSKEANLVAVREFLLHRFKQDESTIFIAYLKGEPVGFTQLYPSFSSVSLKLVFILIDLYVISAARNIGVASSLLDAAKNYAKAQGAVRLSLTTAIDNKIAQKLYEANGWMRDDQFLVYHLPKFS